MIKLRQYRHNLFLLALAIVCTAGTVCAQENVPGRMPCRSSLTASKPRRLVLTQPAPEYPPVAKVNYIQGHVQLELTVNGKGKVDQRACAGRKRHPRGVGPESDAPVDLPSADHALGAVRVHYHGEV